MSDKLELMIPFDLSSSVNLNMRKLLFAKTLEFSKCGLILYISKEKKTVKEVELIEREIQIRADRKARVFISGRNI